MSDQAQKLDPQARALSRLMDLARTDPQLSALIPIPAVTDAIRAPGLSFEQVINTTLRGYAGRPALGRRAYDIVTDPATGRQTRRHRQAFDFITYDELRQRVEAVASAWRHHPEHRVGVGDFVAIFGFTGVDYATCDLATTYAQGVSVPLQANLAPADVADVFKDIEPVTLVVAIDSLDTVVELALSAPTVRSLVVIDADLRDDEDRQRVEAAKAKLAGKIALILLDEPHGNAKTYGFSTGGWVAAPAAGRVIERIAPFLGVKKRPETFPFTPPDANMASLGEE